MAKTDKSFEDFLSEAPLAPDTSTLTVVGALSRVPEPGKFMLTLADGRSVTLETKAVKSFTPLGGAVGQSLAQLELNAKLVPKDFGAAPVAHNVHTVLATDPIHAPTLPMTDPKLPIFDLTVLAYDHLKPPIVDSLQLKPVADPPWMGGGDPSIAPVAGAGVSPFALATAHQAPAGTVAAVEQAGLHSPFTTSIYDYITLPFFDHKPLPKTHADPQTLMQHYGFIPPVTYPWSEPHLPKFFEHTTVAAADPPPKSPPDDR
ncbi:MAG TPA: hypothetical protein VMF53_06040 [Alphaproteobacteria bacterium]|nr:hypothetical protein [Alphaproteobacteria bacterium]